MSNTKRALGLLMAIVVVAACWPRPALAARLGADARTLVKGSNAFAIDLYGKLKDKPGNLFFSPYSISTALAMTYAGARANTEAQMAKVLHFGVGQDKLHGLFKSIGDVLNAGGRERGCQLSVANALWGQQGERFLDRFLTVTRANYGAGLRQVDFKNATEAARQRINAWVSEQTQGKIKELIAKGDLGSLTRLVLTNAIYFKGKWLILFDKDRTWPGPFTLLDGKRIDVPMMHLGSKLGYLDTPQFQALELPYAGRTVAMVVLLPRRHDGLPDLEKALTPAFLAKWLPKIKKHKVLVTLPKFKLASKFELKKPLAALGMASAFAGADFSGINGKRNLFIDEVLHNAVVEVNEEGTEAAGATAVLIKANGGKRPPRVRADHPFLFVIRHNPTGSILFIGRVANPKE